MVKKYFFAWLFFGSLAWALDNNKLEADGNPYNIVDCTNETGYHFVCHAQYQQGDEAELSATIIKNLLIEVWILDSTVFRVRITDNDNNERFIPKIVPTFITPSQRPALYSVSIKPGPMEIRINRTTPDGINRDVFHLNPTQPFQYNDHDIMMVNDVGYNIKVMGFGERIAPFILPTGHYTMWARDRASPYDDGRSPGKGNMYSVHPFFLAVDENFNAFGGALFNANAQNAIVADTSVGFRTTGGIIDYYGFTGPIIPRVIEAYHESIGLPTLVPFWGYGYHQSRYGWNNLTKLEEIVNDFGKYELPLDGIWSDIDDLALNYTDFTLNETRYPHDEFKKWISNIQIGGKHFIPIVDAGISSDFNPSQFTKLKAAGCYIKDPYSTTDTPILATVWPYKAAFVDWLHGEATNYWVDQLTDYQELVHFSGIWIDMNEVSIFNDGSFNHAPTELNCTNGKLDWCPGNIDLNQRSLDIAAKHEGGEIEFNLHSLYGTLEAIATNSYFTNVLKTRPFIISRSSFPGHGRYASKWLGDNFSQWSFLEYSITGVYNFQMFGIPFIGADICGFLGNTTEELCSRWMQLGTLYPFSRNHNDIHSVDQEPWSFGNTLLGNAGLAIRNRYYLILYIYSGMHRLSQNGGTFFQPAFFVYPNDPMLYDRATESFMLGESLIVHPCLTSGQTKKTVYFPYDAWFNLYQGDYLHLGYENLVDLDMPLYGKINIHVKSGSIIPTPSDYDRVNSLKNLRKSNIHLLIVLDGQRRAGGFNIFDDGLSVNGTYSDVNYQWTSKANNQDALTITVANSNPYVKPPDEFPNIDGMTIYNCVMSPKTFKFEGEEAEIPSRIYWDYKASVCRIDFIGPTYPEPDKAGTLLIDYYV